MDFLLDENGQLIINTIVPFGKKLPPPAARARAQEVLATQKTLVSDVIFGLVTERPFTTLNIPVMTANGEKFVLAVVFSTDHFNKLMMSADIDKNWLVELHSRSVTAYSNGDGRGSEFIVRLHRLEEEKNELSSPAVLGNPKPTSETAARIVVVDDNEGAANMLALFLTEAGQYDVRTYFDAQRALDNIENDQAVVYILDIGLPDMDGYELARRIRASSIASHAKLIALTGYGQ